jgi:hypothetical protein
MLKGIKMEKMMGRDEAIDLLKKWGYAFEVDAESDFFKDVIEELVIPVQNGRLSYDLESDSFSYKLIKPVNLSDGSKLELVSIREISLKELRGIRGGETIDSGISIIAKACNLKADQLEELKQRDFGKINAVILGFFLQGSTPRSQDR